MGVHDGHRKRLKTQFLIHGEDFHDHQLLELLLCYAIPQGDVNGLAHALLDQFGSLAGVFDALPPSLTRVDGVGEHTAVLLKLIPKLAGRYSTIRSSPGDILASSRAARDYLLPYFQTGPRNEMVYLVCMDAKYKVLGCHKLGEGTVNAADITPRRVVELAKQVKPSPRGELEITDLNRLYLERGDLRVQVLGRGFAWLDTGTMDSLMEASNFIYTVQNRQGLVISAPEEIAYHEQWITKEELIRSAGLYGKSPYGEHLRRVAADKLVF